MLKNRLNPCQIKKQSKRMQVKTERGNVLEARKLINKNITLFFNIFVVFVF